MPSSDGFLDLPPRPGKPRTEGLTHVIDKGLNLREIEGLFDTAGQYVDIVKLGWGTSYVTNNLEKKIALYRSFETPVVCGGTLFEAVYARGKLDEFRHWLTDQSTSVAASSGTYRVKPEGGMTPVRTQTQRIVRPVFTSCKVLVTKARARVPGCGNSTSTTR